MSAPKRVERPLSPFMIGPYYRPQMTSISSIMVRITGIALIGSMAMIVAWIFTAAVSKDWFDCVNWLLTSWFGALLWVLSAWAVWYHFLGGLRHFLFDAGKGMEIGTAEKLGLAMFIGASVLTVLTVVIACI